MQVLWRMKIHVLFISRKELSFKVEVIKYIVSQQCILSSLLEK